jgi:hypothetical protein
MCERSDRGARYLGVLGEELRARGVKCELLTTGSIPRLWVDIPWLSGCDPGFHDNVLAGFEPDGHWRYWWPSIEPIARVEDLAEAVDHICEMAADPWQDDGVQAG